MSSKCSCSSIFLVWISNLIKNSTFLMLWEICLAGRRAKLALGDGGGLLDTRMHLSRCMIFLPTAAPGAGGLLVHRRVWRSSGVWSVWRRGANTGIAWESKCVHGWGWSCLMLAWYLRGMLATVTYSWCLRWTLDRELGCMLQAWAI